MGMTVRRSRESDYRNPNCLVITAQPIGDAAALYLSGPLTAKTTEARVLQDIIEEIVPAFETVLVNVSQLNRIDSYGLDTIEDSYGLARRKGGELVMCSPGAVLLRQLSRLPETDVPIFRTESAALEVFDEWSQRGGDPRELFHRAARRSFSDTGPS